MAEEEKIEEQEDEVANQFQEVRNRENQILLEIEQKRLKLTEELQSIPNPTKADRQKYITEIRNLEAIRLAHGSPQEKLNLFKMDIPDFAQKNTEENAAERPISATVDEGKQLIHRILETMKGVMYKQKMGTTDVWERNKSRKNRRSVQGSRYHAQKISRKYAHIRPEKPEKNARSKQDEAGDAGDGDGVAGKRTHSSAPF
jgi:hypothetical protein